MVGQTLSHYRVTAALGAGGMGEVYKATDTNLGREVAIKVLPPEVAQDRERLARFRREAQLLASLNHTNIAAIYGLEEADGKPFLALELVEGEDLKERLGRGAIPEDEALDIALQITAALEEAHEKGIVHRDLKPANVKLTPDGKVKVLDFGLAKARGGDPTAPSSDLSQSPTVARSGTRAGVILGTPAYMSPEQASGKAVDRRTDIWSFGVVLFEMLTGRRLFSGATTAEMLASVIERDPPWDALPGDCPAPLTRLLRRCLQKRSRQRLQDIGDARLELEDALSREEGEPGGRKVGAPPTWRRALPWGLAAALTTTCLALALRSPPEPELTQLDVVPPQGTRIWGLGSRTRPAVSPDGRRVAFSAWDTEGRAQIYIRRFDAGEARALAETDGGSFPFWSPDSRFIGFFADGELKKVEVGGGALVSLCDAPGGRGGSWSPQGVIVFCPNLGAPLHRVPDGGGEPSPITRLGSSGNDDSHRFPHFLPDGRRFLYLARASSEMGDTHAVMAGSLEDPEGKLLLQSSAAATYASGHLLYVRDGTLHARPLDLKRLELTGEETPLAQGVRVDSPGFAAFPASPNGILAYLSGERQTLSTLEWHDREGTNLGTLGEPAGHLGVVLSPDGARAAAAIEDAHQVPDLWIYDIARDLRTRFTFHAAWDLAVVWPPDGRSVVFSSWRQGGDADLYRKPLEGSGEVEPLLVLEGDALGTDVSPDGKLLLFQRTTADENTDLWILPLDGDSEPRPFLESKFNESRGVFSPDGRWIAHVSDESERSEVYVAAFPSGRQKQQISTEGGLRPLWRDDGREIFYKTLDQRLMAVKVEATAERLVVGETESLFQLPVDPSPAAIYSAMPDGQRFLVVTPVETEVSIPLAVVLNWPRLLKR